MLVHIWLWQYQYWFSGMLWAALSLLSLFFLILLINLATYPRLTETLA